MEIVNDNRKEGRFEPIEIDRSIDRSQLETCLTSESFVAIASVEQQRPDRHTGLLNVRPRPSTINTTLWLSVHDSMTFRGVPQNRSFLFDVCIQFCSLEMFLRVDTDSGFTFHPAENLSMHHCMSQYERVCDLDSAKADSECDQARFPTPSALSVRFFYSNVYVKIENCPYPPIVLDISWQRLWTKWYIECNSYKGTSDGESCP